MKRFYLLFILLLSLAVAKADNEITFQNNWGNSVTITVNTPGDAATGLAALSESDKQVLKEATVITLKGSPNATDFASLAETATAAQMFDCEDLSVEVPTDATFPATAIGLIAQKGQALASGNFTGMKWVLSRNASNTGEITVLLNEAGAYAHFYSQNPKYFMWSTSSMHIIGTLGLTDVESLKNTNCDTFDLSLATGLTIDQLLSKGNWGGHKLVLLPNGTAMPDAETAKKLSGNSSWQELRVVTKIGEQIVISSFNNPSTLSLSDTYLAGVTAYADKTGNLTDDDKTFLSGKNIKAGEEVVPFDGTTVSVDLSSQALAAALTAAYSSSDKTPESTLKHLIVTGGSLGGVDLSAYTALETLSLPTTCEAANRPATLPASMKYIYYNGTGENHTGAAIQLLQAGQMSDAVNRYVDILDLTQLKLIGQVNDSDLDFGSMLFDMTKVNLIDLNEVSSDFTPSAIKWNVVWGSTAQRVVIVAPKGADLASYVSSDWGIRSMTGAICAYDSTGEVFRVHVVNEYNPAYYDLPQKTMKITVESNNVSQVLAVINVLSDLNVPEIDLSDVTFPNGTSISVTNNNLERGINLGTQTVNGNYTLSAANTEFTSYTLKGEITGDVDLSGSIYLTTLDLRGATIGGTITLPKPSEIRVTVSSSDMKAKVRTAGVPEEHITFDDTASGTVVERGDYVIINYSLTESNKGDFNKMLDDAVTMAGTTKKIVIRATTGFQNANLEYVKTKGVDVYYDMYEIDGQNSYAQLGVKGLLAGIKAGTYKKPLGILLPKDIQYEATGDEVPCTVDEVAALCVDFAGRARSVNDSKIVSMMFVNKGESDDENTRNDQTRQHFNAGADIALMHSDLRAKSMMYLVGTDDNNFVNTDDRIPATSKVTLLKVERNFINDTANGEVTVERAGELANIIGFAGRMVENENVNDLVVRTAEGVELNADDVAAINDYTQLKGVNLFSAKMEEGLTLTNSSLVRLGLIEGTINYDAIKSNLTTIVAYDPTPGKEFVNVTAKEAGKCEDAFLLVEPAQREVLKNVSIKEGSVLNDADLKYFAKLPNVCLIDLSEAELTSNTDLRNIITGDKEYNDRVAYILPTTATTTLTREGEVRNPVLDFQYDGDWTRLLTMARYDDNTKKRLSIWTYPDKTALANYAPVVNSNMVVTFMPKFEKVGVAGAKPAGYMNFKNGDADLWDELKELECGAVDFNWVNISDLAYDFSKLASTVKHIMIPTSNSTKSGVEYQGFDDETNGYTYASSILTVSTFKSPAEHASATCKYKGGVFTADEPTLVTYVRSNGTGSFSEVHDLLNANTQAVTRLNLIGTINCEDIAGMKAYTAATKQDLHLATLADGVNLPECINGNTVVQYLALPDNDASLSVTDADACNYKTSCSNLLGVGVYDTSTNTYSTWTSAVGNVLPLTLMIHPTTDTENRLAKNSTYCAGLNNIVMSGYLNMADITCSEGGGLNNASIHTADLTNAIFPTQTDMVFTGHTPGGVDPAPANAAWGSSIESVKLPVDASMDTLPDYMLGNAGSLKYVCIPGNYKHIGSYAFYSNDQLVTVTTTEVDNNGDGRGEELCYDATGKNTDLSELAIENYPKTVTLPANLESIKTGAFQLDEHFTDVYVLNTGNAPTCERNSFGEGTLMGWGGFNNVSPITRNSYANGTGENASKTFAILHWPADIALDEVKKYTDVTRQYSIYDELQTIDGDGHVYIWPNQVEFYHAYITGTYGYLWGAYDKEKSAEMSGYQTTAEQVANANPSQDEQYKFSTDYAGWHQFVLTGSVDYNPTAPEAAAEYTELDYYTICLPFDLTYDQLNTLFGVPQDATLHRLDGTEEKATSGIISPRVSTLYRVTRNYSSRKITLHFTEGLMEKAANDGKCSWNTTTEKFEDAELGANNSPIVMKEGYPYLIVPIVPTSIINTVKADVRAYLKRKFEALGNVIGTGTEAKIPYEEWSVQAYREDEQKEMYGANNEYEYRYLFIGTYDPMGRIPDYAYFMAFNNSKNFNTWYRNVWGDAYQGTWNANTSIIGANPVLVTNEVDIPKAAKKAAPMTDSNRQSYRFDLKLQDDYFVISGQNVRASYLMTFDEQGDDATTAIEGIDEDGRIRTTTYGNIYNLQGQLVRRDGTTAGLPAGMYIVNGKKVIVK